MTTETGNDYSTFVGVQGVEREVPIVFLFNTGTQPNQTFITKMMNMVTTVKVSYALGASTSVTLEVVDPGFEFTKQNYFQPKQTFIYKSHNFNKIGETHSNSREGYVGYFMEVADVTISQGPGNSPIVRIQGYTKAVQQMKRDRKPGVITGANHNFVINAAKKYGLDCVAQETSKDKNITSADGEKMADSLWDVLQNLAGESKDKDKNPYQLFEMDGTLFFGTQQWLMYKWGIDKYTHTRYNKKKQQNVETTRYVTYLHYPQRVVNGKRDDRFTLLQLPNMHKAENDPLQGDGSCIVDRSNGVRLRPGMTVNVADIPWHSGDFLIQSVDFDEMVADPVAVTFSTPPIANETKIKEVEVGTIYPGSVDWATVEGLAAPTPPPKYTTPQGTRGDIPVYE